MKCRISTRKCLLLTGRSVDRNTFPKVLNVGTWATGLYGQIAFVKVNARAFLRIPVGGITTGTTRKNEPTIFLPSGVDHQDKTYKTLTLIFLCWCVSLGLELVLA